MNHNEKKIRPAALTFLLGVAQIYAWATTYYLPATLIEIIANETGQSSLVIVGGFSWALLISGLSAPKIGAWIEHEGGRRPLALGSVLMGLGLLILSATQGVFMWYLGWTVIGFGMALGLFNAAFAAIGRLFGHASKKMIIRITLISGFATLLWPITTSLIQTVGWKTMLVYYSIPYFIVWAPLYFFTIPAWVPEHTETRAAEQTTASKKATLLFYLLALYAILRSVVGTTISVDILIMFGGLGLTLGAAALVASFIGPAQIVGRVIEMFVGRNFDPLKSSIFWTAVLPVAIFSLLLGGMHAAPIFAIAYGMSNGVLTITMGILPMILFGSKGYATLLGKLALPVLIAQALAPLLVAPLLERWTAMQVFMLAGGIGILALLCLIFLAFISKQPDTHEAMHLKSIASKFLRRYNCRRKGG